MRVVTASKEMLYVMSLQEKKRGGGGEFLKINLLGLAFEQDHGKILPSTFQL